MKTEHHPFYIIIAAASAFSFFGGAMVERHFVATNPKWDQNIDRAVFGGIGVNPDRYPACQTDLEMAEYWTPHLMWLNGIWTAACIHQTDQLREDQ